MGGGTGIFLCLEGILYAGFLALDLTGQRPGWSAALKYASILLCFAFAWRRARDTDGRLVTAALGGTLTADLFLLVLDRWYLAGVTAFCVVQGLYLLRIRRLRAGNRGALRSSLAWRAGLVLAFWGALAWLDTLEPLTVLTALYFSQLLANTAESLTLGRKWALFSGGLILFVCCDLCVGLHNLPAFLPGTDGGVLSAFAQVGMWLFYLPSQVLITLSAGKE